MRYLLIVLGLSVFVIFFGLPSFAWDSLANILTNETGLTRQKVRLRAALISSLHNDGIGIVARGSQILQRRDISEEARWFAELKWQHWRFFGSRLFCSQVARQFVRNPKKMSRRGAIQRTANAAILVPRNPPGFRPRCLVVARIWEPASNDSYPHRYATMISTRLVTALFDV